MGWTPCAWQGWIVLVVYFVLMMTILDIEKTATRRLCGAALTVGLIGIAMCKTNPRNRANK